jgi:hypothetical protein
MTQHPLTTSACNNEHIPSDGEMFLLAYSVSASFAVSDIIVFADTEINAKILAKRTDIYSGFPLSEIRCTRQPAIDKYAAIFGSGALGISEPEEQDLMRMLGWHQWEEGAYECRVCSLYEWDQLPNSRLDYNNSEHDPICEGCKTCICQS